MDEKQEKNCPYATLLELNLGTVEEKYESVIEYMSRLRVNKEHTDITLVTRDSKESGYSETKVHSFVINARCPMLKELIANKTTVIIDEVYTNVLKAYISFLYTGEIHLSGKSDISKLLQFCYHSKTNFRMIYKVATTSEVYLSSNFSFVEQIQADYMAMINDQTTSDLTIKVFDQETNELQRAFYVHKVIMVRAEYIQTCLDAGMKESLENCIEFYDVSVDSMETIIRLLYGDEMIVGGENAVELYVYSTLFQLQRVVRTCRRVITSNFDASNIGPLSYFAETFSDKTLTKYCATYIMRNHEELDIDMNSIAPACKILANEGINKKNKVKLNKARNQERTDDLFQLSLRDNMAKLTPMQIRKLYARVFNTKKHDTRK
jgi:hypothetical protein